MNRRLYFILPDVEISRKVEDDLLLARITEHQMHFLGKRGTDMQDLPEASQIQKTDIIHGFFRISIDKKCFLCPGDGNISE